MEYIYANVNTVITYYPSYNTSNNTSEKLENFHSKNSKCCSSIPLKSKGSLRYIRELNKTKTTKSNKKFKKPKTQKNYKIKKPKIKCHTKDCIENNANKIKARNSNKEAHITFGNKSKSH